MSLQLREAVERQEDQQHLRQTGQEGHQSHQEASEGSQPLPDSVARCGAFGEPEGQTDCGDGHIDDRNHIIRRQHGVETDGRPTNEAHIAHQSHRNIYKL